MNGSLNSFLIQPYTNNEITIFKPVFLHDTSYPLIFKHSQIMILFRFLFYFFGFRLKMAVFLPHLFEQKIYCEERNQIKYKVSVHFMETLWIYVLINCFSKVAITNSKNKLQLIIVTLLIIEINHVSQRLL